jgi:hypothetical protein
MAVQRLETLHQLLEVTGNKPCRGIRGIGPPDGVRGCLQCSMRPQAQQRRHTAPNSLLQPCMQPPRRRPLGPTWWPASDVQRGYACSPPPQATHDGYLAADAAQHVTEVSVAGAGRRLSLWPPLLSSFTRLTRITIRGHFITALPASVGDLVNLQVGEAGGLHTGSAEESAAKSLGIAGAHRG